MDEDKDGCSYEPGEDDEEYICPDCKRKHGYYLSKEEIDIEINGIGKFFERVDPAIRQETGVYVLFEIVNQVAFSLIDALGMLEEAKFRYREIVLQVAEDHREEWEDK